MSQQSPTRSDRSGARAAAGALTPDRLIHWGAMFRRRR
ncbi:hypothetical protein FAGKG844_30035 [Frankia sp. AgKG'84/4]